MQVKGPQCPFGLLSALCRRTEGKSRADKALNVGKNEAVGSREAGGRLFTSPEHCGTQARSKAKGVNTHRSLPGGSDRRLRGRISPRKGDKFGVVGELGVCETGGSRMLNREGTMIRRKKGKSPLDFGGVGLYNSGAVKRKDFTGTRRTGRES